MKNEYRLSRRHVHNTTAYTTMSYASKIRKMFTDLLVLPLRDVNEDCCALIQGERERLPG